LVIIADAGDTFTARLKRGADPIRQPLSAAAGSRGPKRRAVSPCGRTFAKQDQSRGKCRPRAYPTWFEWRSPL